MTEAMKPSPSPAATGILSNEALAHMRIVIDGGKLVPGSIVLKLINEIEGLRKQLTPSQSDVEAAREWLFKHYGFRNLNVMSHEVDALASLLASRGTRALTPRMKAAVTLARNHSGEDLSALLIADLLKAIDHLTGEPSA